MNVRRTDPGVGAVGGRFVLTEDDLDGVLAWTAIRVGRRMERMLTGLLAGHGLTPVQFGVLAQLQVHSALAQADLARAIGIRAQSTRQVVTEMQQRGLLERLGPGGRGRRTDIALTDTGRDLLARTWPLVTGTRTALSADDEAALNTTLHTLLGAPVE